MKVKMYLTSMSYLSPSYEHVIDFGSKAARNEFFIGKQDREVYSNVKYDDNRAIVNVDMPIEECNNYDYLFFNGQDRVFFYFIVGIEYFTPKTTNLIIELDVFNTYFYDCELLPSFVDRAHVDRWTSNGLPTSNYQDEGIAIGEYIIQELPTKLCGMNNSIVVASSVPIGITENSSGAGSSGDSGGGYGGTSWRDGKISAMGFRFIKGFEGFYANPYQDSGGYWTIGYGTTKHGEPDLYNELAAKAPISEEEAAKIMYDSICSRYGAKILQAAINLGVTEQYQFDALVSVAYNCGVGAITGSNTLTNAIGADITNEATIRAAWENFRVTSGGTYLEGLYLRRVQECNMFFGKEFELRAIVNVDGSGWLPTDNSNMEDDSSEPINGYKTYDNDFGTGWLIPVKGARISSPYGWRNCPYHGREMHPGVDLAISQGTPVLATKGGTVTRCAYDSSMGNYIYIEHAGGIITKYMHLSKQNVSVGDTVTKGQQIGEVGSTGSSTGPHLHWEFRNSSNESCVPIASMNTTGQKP